MTQFYLDRGLNSALHGRLGEIRHSMDEFLEKLGMQDAYFGEDANRIFGMYFFERREEFFDYSIQVKKDCRRRSNDAVELDVRVRVFSRFVDRLYFDEPKFSYAKEHSASEITTEEFLLEIFEENIVPLL